MPYLDSNQSYRLNHTSISVYHEFLSFCLPGPPFINLLYWVPKLSTDMAGQLSSLVLLVFSSCIPVGGQNCSLSGTGQLGYMRDDVRSCHVCLPKMIFNFTAYADAQFRSSNLTVCAESVGGSTPGARVTWNITAPPKCVTSLRVNFRTTTTNRLLVATYTTTNTSQTEIIQTGLRCGTSYYIRVVVSGKPRYQGVLIDQILSSNQVRVYIGGNKEIVCMIFQL